MTRNNIEKRLLGAEGNEIVVNVTEGAEKRMNKTEVVRSECRMHNPTLESSEDGATIIRGYAAVYNADSEDLGGFIERIAVGAFDGVLDNDVRCYINHDENRLVGRVSSGTLVIGVDERGLYYEAKLPDTSYARDLKVLMERGDITESSFAFLIEDDTWEQRDGVTYRIITKVSRLLDVSPVSQPAYPDATSEIKRDLEVDKETKSASAEASESEAVEEAEVSNLYLYKSKLLNL